ncbi:hypothetical protein GGH91_001507, partial [Coemansia sp. RSA 2671]
AQAIVSPVSALFGPIVKPAASDSDAQQRALQVRATLVLQPAQPTKVLAPSEPEFTLVTSKRKRPEPTRPAEPVVISETYAEYHAPAPQRKPAPPVDSMQLPKIALGDIDDTSDDEGPKPKKSVSKKAKKRKTTGKPSVSSTDVTPFEYADNPESEVIGESAKPVDKKKRKQGRPAKSFDPYSQISTTKELAKKP